MFAANMDGVHIFAANHSKGIGDVVHRATSAMGIKRCGPCARRQAAMNGGGVGAFFKNLLK